LLLFGFLRIEEVVQSGISDHTLEVDEISKHNQSNNEFIKN
jgi:type IV secretory pathway TrbL component